MGKLSEENDEIGWGRLKLLLFFEMGWSRLKWIDVGWSGLKLVDFLCDRLKWVKIIKIVINVW